LITAKEAKKVLADKYEEKVKFEGKLDEMIKAGGSPITK
jgi:hypothetical protein